MRTKTPDNELTTLYPVFQSRFYIITCDFDKTVSILLPVTLIKQFLYYYL